MTGSEKSSATKHLCIVEKGKKAGRRCANANAVAQIGDDIKFDPQILNSLGNEGCLKVHYDLLVLCAAIEFADRFFKRSEDWSRSLHLTVPVIELGTWQRAEVQKTLIDVLRHLTCDSWSFEFIQAKDLSPLSWRQLPIRTGQEKKTFAIAYSEGLDSRAVAALSGKKEEAVCIRVAKNRQQHSYSDSYFTSIPFKVTSRGRESSFRSRGFQFAAITGIAAQLTQVRSIVVPESGQGVFSPVLLPLHLIYVDYRNHPSFFVKMERFLQEVLGYKVEFKQPRMWFTKGQTLTDFLALPDKKADDLSSTRSCWQTRRIVNHGGKRRQCGLCAACILRRLSMHTAGVEERPDTYVIKDLKAAEVGKALSVLKKKDDRHIMIEYGMAGTRHFQRLAELSKASEEKLRVPVAEIAEATGESKDEISKKLRGFLYQHAQEWQDFLSEQGDRSFLKDWLDGGCDD